MGRYTEATIPDGVTASYRHGRNPQGKLLFTDCFLRDEHGTLLATGCALVSRQEKSPSKKIGRDISLGRALKELKETGYDGTGTTDGN